MSRHFPSLVSTITEVQRDLAKAPAITFSRVQQHIDQTIPGREIIGYHYSLPIEEISPDPGQVVHIAARYLPFYAENREAIINFMHAELESRWDASGRFDATPNERQHPALRSSFEGNHLSYTYAERLVGATEAVIAAFEHSPDTRRAFVPVFNHTDMLRAHAPTRVPCTIGYQFVGRLVNGEYRLNAICFQRSCDFGRFWLTDLWFAANLARRFCEIEIGGVKWKPGIVHHMLGSLHTMEDLQNVY